MSRHVDIVASSPPLADAPVWLPEGTVGARGPRPPGQTGLLDVTAERLAGRTRITDLRCRAPLQALRPHYLDPASPDMAFLTIASPSGGVLQGDRLDLRVRLGRGARLHLDTQGATRIYRAPDAPATMTTTFDLGPCAYLEYLPDPFIPYAGSRFAGLTGCLVPEDASLITWEIVGAGREAHGERHAFERFESRLRLSRPDGELVAADAVELAPREALGAPGRLGAYLVVGTLLIVQRGFRLETLRPALVESPGGPTLAGASSLAQDAGAWVRVLARSAADAGVVLEAAFALARMAILGAGPAPARRA